MRLGRTTLASISRLLTAAALSCALLGPVAAVHAWSGIDWGADLGSHGPTVKIVLLGSPPVGPEGWSTLPVQAVLVPSDPGETWYRVGPAPGPWQRCTKPIAVPAGKQTLSAVAVGVDGVAGPVAETVVRSDFRLLPVAGVGAPLAASPSFAAYTGYPSVAGTIRVGATVEPRLGTAIRRLGGTDRYGTSAKLSSAGFPSATTVIIATGQKFPDALAASGLAGCLSAPVLLVQKNSIPTPTRNELRRLHAKRVIICGGPPAVSDGVAKKFRAMGLKVERLSGPTRYETAIAISQRIQKLTGRSDRVFFARGDFFADALIVSPLAYATRSPILLTTRGSLNPTVARRLTQAKYRSAVIVGAVGGRPEGGIRNRVLNVERWGGANQFESSVQVASHESLEGPVSWSYVGIARGDIFPDALCGGELAGKRGGVILLTQPTRLTDCVRDALTAHAGDIRVLEVYGSERAVTAGVFNQIKAALQ